MLKHKYLNFMGYAQSIILSTFVKRFVKISMPIVIAIIQQFKLFYLWLTMKTRFYSVTL